MAKSTAITLKRIMVKLGHLGKKKIPLKAFKKKKKELRQGSQIETVIGVSALSQVV